MVNFVNGSMYCIYFGKTVGSEINDEHFGIVFNIKSNDNMVLCIPMTSPKEKHFLTEKDFNDRNYLKLKYPHTYYIKDTDSIVLIDQMRVISKKRLKSIYVDPETGIQKVFCDEEMDIIKIKIEKFMYSILYKK